MIRRLRKNERGATLVEGAIVGVLVFALIFGVFQAAFLARASIAAEDGSTAGARAAAVAGNDPLADRDLLRAVQRAGSSLSSDGIVSVVVYKAANFNTPVPTACLTAAQKDVCNVYTNADLNRPDADFSAGTWQAPQSWPATSRNVGRGTADYVGVYVQTKCGCSGAYAFPSLLSRSAIQRVES